MPSERIYVCPPGRPGMADARREPNVPADGCILFVGTLEPRKNIGALLDAYTDAVERQSRAAPRLVLAGGRLPDAAAWLERLAGRRFRDAPSISVTCRTTQQEALYASARVLVLPSLDEGFGLPVLAAMSAGIPVVASRRGALPEVVGDGGTLFDPEQPGALASLLNA